MSLLLIKILIGLGLFLSIYSHYVLKHKEKNYRALCDINEEISCSKVFESKYGKFFGISNSIYGIIFFAGIFILSIYSLIEYMFYLSVISAAFGTYLIYILLFKLKFICIVCYGVYLVTLLILILSYLLL